MRITRELTAAASVVVLMAVCGVGLFLTREQDAGRGPTTQAAQTDPVDERLFQAVKQLCTLADTAAEQTAAREAMRQVDHELDLAFASALREAAAAPAPTAAGPLKQASDRVEQIKARVAADQQQIERLKKAAASSDAAAARLELAQAQLALDEGELDAAQEDLLALGGDRHELIDRQRTRHEASNPDTVPFPKLAEGGQPGTLAAELQFLLSLQSRLGQIEAVRQQALTKGAALGREYKALEALVNKNPLAAQANAAAAAGDEYSDAGAEEDASEVLARLRGLSDQRKTLAEFGSRIQDCQKAGEALERWAGLVEARRIGALRLVLRSVMLILACILAALAVLHALGLVLKRKAERDHTEVRRQRQMRGMLALAVQVACGVVILLIIFGPPSQISTIIGFATAGLTLVMKDFILAFFGWFTLMGRNGIHVGDWVEIQGVSGEVIEVGVFHTVLLEMGSGSGIGHPTGRRVSFMNSYALEKHWFNFTTAGQWLWDELNVGLPATGDHYQQAEATREIVERETAAEAAAAELEWQRVTREYGVPLAGTRPTADLRPVAGGLEVRVRYITRAPHRYAVRSRLFTEIVKLLHTAPEKATEQTEGT